MVRVDALRGIGKRGRSCGRGEQKGKVLQQAKRSRLAEEATSRARVRYAGLDKKKSLQTLGVARLLS